MLLILPHLKRFRFILFYCDYLLHFHHQPQWLSASKLRFFFNTYSLWYFIQPATKIISITVVEYTEIEKIVDLIHSCGCQTIFSVGKKISFILLWISNFVFCFCCKILFGNVLSILVSWMSYFDTSKIQCILGMRMESTQMKNI